MEVYTFMVPRISTEENTFAQIYYWAEHPIPPAEFADGLRQKLTAYFRTPEGAAMLASTSYDFNIGDLVNEFTDEQMHEFRPDGVSRFEVEIHSGQYVQTDWTYDEHLFDEEELEPVD